MFTIRLNPKARKIGRPALDRKAVTSEQRLDRAHFNVSEVTRCNNGDISIQRIMDKLDAGRPSLRDYVQLNQHHELQNDHPY